MKILKLTKSKVTFLGVLVLIFAVAYMPLLNQKKYMMYSWEARIFVAFQNFTPEEARNLILEKGEKHNENHWWRYAYVIGKEYFFPSGIGPRFGKMQETGYYVNPKTKEVRKVNEAYFYNFPLLSDESALRVEIELKGSRHGHERIKGSRHDI